MGSPPAVNAFLGHFPQILMFPPNLLWVVQFFNRASILHRHAPGRGQFLGRAAPPPPALACSELGKLCHGGFLSDENAANAHLPVSCGLWAVGQHLGRPPCHTIIHD